MPWVFNWSTGLFDWTEPAGLVAADIDTSAKLAAIVGDETGTGALVFATDPQLAGTVKFSGNLKTTGGDFSLLDSNGNELAKLDQQASAVNELTLKNATASNSPEIEATGDDANIDIKATPKGTGGLSVGGTGVSILQEAIVINESGADEDSRFEGDTDANLLFIDAGTDRVGVGNAAPTDKFHVTGNFRTTGEMKGSRMPLQFDRTSMTADGYLGSAALAYAATYGFPMHRAGSIVGVSVSANVTVQTNLGTIILHVYKNGASVFSVTVTSAGVAAVSGYATQARDVDQFVAGDLITAYVDFGTFVGTIAPIIALIDCQLDT